MITSCASISVKIAGILNPEGQAAVDSFNLGKDVDGGYNEGNKSSVLVNKGQQDKHILGTNNYLQDVRNGKFRGIFQEDPQKLLDDFAGFGEKVGMNKERVDFGRVIGKYFDMKTGEYWDTTKGMINYDDQGQAHIVPAKP